MKNTLIPSVGEQIGRWTVIGGPVRQVRKTANSANYFDAYECRCECGTVRLVRVAKLRGNSKSCGCLKSDMLQALALRHGHARTGLKSRLYSIWRGMKSRCSSPSHDGYALYGGRGIFVCPGWADFQNFARWAEGRYAPTLQIDRIDPDGPYSPENCRWVTTSEQARNKRNLTVIRAFGEERLATDWALDPRCTISPQSIVYRIKKLGLTAEDAISLPRRTRKSSPEFIGNHVNRSSHR